MAYDGRHHTLDIAVGSTILALNTQKGLAIERRSRSHAFNS